MSTPTITDPATAAHSGGAPGAPKFWLGAPEPAWLDRTSVPLFLARPRLARIKKLRRARGPWALDSGGFSQLSLRGRWTLTAAEYAVQVRRFVDQVGRPDWLAQQDWMCEPDIRAKTGLTVLEHQHRTVQNLVDLRALLPGLPVIPVVQGWTVGEYLHCVEMFARAGVDLTQEPLVGVGSICRRQSSIRIGFLLKDLHRAGVHHLHGFGLKQEGLRHYGYLLRSADSMAWSYAARAGRERCPEGRTDCRNCMHFALEWREDLLDRLPSSDLRGDLLDPGVVASASVQQHPSPQQESSAVPGSLLTREDIARRLGVAVSTLYRWQADAHRNGFPEPDPSGRWDAERIDLWYAGLVQTKRAKLRPVDRDGDPDELLDATEAGRVLGYRGNDPGATIRSYRQPRHGGYFPEPDGTVISPSGRRVQAWRRGTIWAFADGREHHGGSTPGSSGRPRSAPYANDPALPTVRALLQATPEVTGPVIAAAVGVSEAKAYRLLKAAKAIPENPDTPVAPDTDSA
jgi:predicted DNA-binding transcriptional regulator AlpA